jgi:hypothetical protein
MLFYDEEMWKKGVLLSPLATQKPNWLLPPSFTVHAIFFDFASGFNHKEEFISWHSKEATTFLRNNKKWWPRHLAIFLPSLPFCRQIIQFELDPY